MRFAGLASARSSGLALVKPLGAAGDVLSAFAGLASVRAQGWGRCAAVELRAVCSQGLVLWVLTDVCCATARLDVMSAGLGAVFAGLCLLAHMGRANV